MRVCLYPLQYEVYKCIKAGMDAEQIQKELNLQRNHYNQIIYELRNLGFTITSSVIHRIDDDDIDVEVADKRIKLTDEKKKELVQRYQSEKITKEQLAKIYRVSRRTVWKILKEFKQNDAGEIAR